MKKTFITILISAASVLIADYFLAGITIDTYLSAVVFAIVLSVLNSLVKPLLVILTLPATIFTLGLFLLAVNAMVVLMADYFVSGINVAGFWWAMIFAIVMSIVNGILNKVLGVEDED